MLSRVKIKLFLFFFTLFSYFHSYSQNDDKGLRIIFSNDFRVGVALNKFQIKESNAEESNLINTHFSSLTPENIMKWEEIHPRLNKYNFKLSDQLIELGKKK